MTGKPQDRNRFVTASAMVAVALNLRPVMASVGPLLDQIESATGLDHTGASLMTTLPVCVMGLGALLAGQLQQRGRARLYVALGIASIALACGARVVLNTRYGLLATSLIAGIGIATIQTMLPGFIKRTWGARAGRVMGLYTTGIMGGAAFAAALSGPLADALGWSFALAVWALPAAIALPLWLGRVPSFAQRGPARVCSRRVGEPVWRRLRAWELMLFFGVGTGAYTLVLAWLPPFYTGLGWSSTHAGYLLGSVTVAEVAAGLCVSAWANRLPDRRRPLLFALAALTGGLVCLIVAPLPLAWLASALLGVGIGALFPLSLIVTLDHIDDPERAGELAAFVQGGGYLIASLAPLGAGALRDRFADLTDAWVLMAFGAALLALLCAQFSPRSYVEFGQ